MECNRDEAKRAKEIAESKFSTKDINGAKKFALKAQSLYPELDGISQMLATLDIYIAAENKINGESDFYGILGVNPLADDDTVRKYYRKLALFLHPDKNKSVGADGAFKYISEAWSLLSDKTKRSAYDQRRNTKAYKQNTTTQYGGQNGFYNFSRSTKGAAKDRGTTSTGPTDKPKMQKTFWTVCHGCKMQYEYLRMYLHQNLLCPNCHEPFLAMETAAPNTKVSTKGFKSKKMKSTGRHGSISQKGESSFQWGPFTNAATMVQETYAKVKREREEAQIALKREEALRRKRNLKRTHNVSSSGLQNSVRKKEEEVSVSSIDIRTRLIKKARNEIRKKLHELISGTVVSCRKENEIKNFPVDEDSLKKSMEPIVIDVQDPDFHNFDKGRCETCFKEGQIWAAYDDIDGMPRHYAMIHKVNSVDPFKVMVCWLNSLTNDDLNMYSAFGEFRLGKHESVSNTNCFSHKVVNFTKLENGILQIYPQKGEVWALYRHWSPEWNEETPIEVKCKYEIVEVDEFDYEAGFSVTQLVKVAGFKTVFHRQINPKQVRMIPEGEIFRFSHRIPSYMLIGQESPNAPKGCCELDPAATPDEFLQVIADLQEPENIDDDEFVQVISNVKDFDLTSNEDSTTVLIDAKEVVNLDDDEQ
ncbi:uncharacterized protein [Rutidosis leptorrhynchoides]|uniref:uncharacterized protein n=1 Tax=Rutidosis leptorrhynchoides TaxID=125765 RepID=UPI003A9A2D3C